MHPPESCRLQFSANTNRVTLQQSLPAQLKLLHYSQQSRRPHKTPVPPSATFAHGDLTDTGWQVAPHQHGPAQTHADSTVTKALTFRATVPPLPHGIAHPQIHSKLSKVGGPLCTLLHFSWMHLVTQHCTLLTSFSSTPEQKSHQISQTWPELQYQIYGATKSVLQQRTRSAKLLVLLPSLTVLLSSKVTVHIKYVKKYHEEEEP